MNWNRKNWIPFQRARRWLKGMRNWNRLGYQHYHTNWLTDQTWERNSLLRSRAMKIILKLSLPWNIFINTKNFPLLKRSENIWWKGYGYFRSINIRATKEQAWGAIPTLKKRESKITKQNRGVVWIIWSFAHPGTFNSDLYGIDHLV